MVMVHQQNNIENGGVAAGLINRVGDGIWPPQTSLRVRRPLLGGRTIGCPSTPVPRWKLYENPFYDGVAAAAAAAAQQKSGRGGAGGRNVAVSARKLAATLWELQEFPVSLAAASNKSPSFPCGEGKSSDAAKKMRDNLLGLANEDTATRCPSYCDSGPHPAFFHSQQAAMAKRSKESTIALQNPNKASENAKKSSQSQSTSSRQVAAMRSHVHRLLERRADAKLSQLASVQGNRGSYMVLNCIRDMQEQQMEATPSTMAAALRIELERARTRAHELELAHKSARREIENVLKKVTEEKASWRNKEKEKIRSAVQAVKMEAEEEKKARRRIESLNRKMSRELIEANIAVAKSVQELERERKSRELMEDVCDELAREIGEDRAEVEVLKRESAKVREEVEEERKMLQMAEVWREERVQMKLAEARLEIEDKNVILDNLRSELEQFLTSKKVFLRDAGDDEVRCRVAVQEAEDLKTALDSMHLREALQNSCRSLDADEVASGLFEVQQNNIRLHPDDRGSWSTKPSTVREASDPRLETRDQVLERLRRKYDHIGQHTSTSGAQDGDGGRKWDAERDGSLCDSQCEHQGNHTKEEDGSQWESASDQDILEAVQHSNSGVSSEIGRGAADNQSGPQAEAPAHPAGYENLSSPQEHVIKSAAELSSGDDSWKVATLAGNISNVDQQWGLSGEGSRNVLGRGMAEVSRSSHMRLVTEQGIASPSRDWRSPDRGNPHIARGIKGFIEWPKMLRENDSKGRVLESKVEKVKRRMLN